jgi:hypothetical protein
MTNTYTEKFPKLLENYFLSQKQIYEFFGYEGGNKVFPIEDSTCYYWQLDGKDDDAGEVIFANSEEELKSQGGDYYSNDVMQRPYRTSNYTAICVDTHVDGNKFLQIFDNLKERPFDWEL